MIILNQIQQVVEKNSFFKQRNKQSKPKQYFLVLASISTISNILMIKVLSYIHNIFS